MGGEDSRGLKKTAEEALLCPKWGTWHCKSVDTHSICQKKSSYILFKVNKWAPYFGWDAKRNLCRLEGWMDQRMSWGDEERRPSFSHLWLPLFPFPPTACSRLFSYFPTLDDIELEHPSRWFLRKRMWPSLSVNDRNRGRVDLISNSLQRLRVIWGQCCQRVAAGPCLSNGSITQLSPYLTQNPCTYRVLTWTVVLVVESLPPPPKKKIPQF